MSDHTEFNLTDLDLLTLEPLSTLPSDERIILNDGKRIEIVGREYLLGVVESEVAKGVRVTEILVKTLASDGAERSFLLRREFWERVLRKDPYKDTFEKFWMQQEAAMSDGTGHEYFLGHPYFDIGEVEKILNLPTGIDVTLLTMLKDLKEKKLGEAELCASHDLAPLFETILEVKWAQINSELRANKKALKK